MKKITLSILLLAMAGMVWAQTAEKLPMDPDVRYGKLENGLTYYIRHNEQPKQRCEFHIAQAVGAILEEDHQNGLAHFLEHTLHEQIKDPDTLEYYYLRADKTGVDYRADYTVWDMYTNCSFQGNSYCAGVIENPYECQCYNREHMLPQSWWGNVNTKRMRTDLHHVIPTDAATNTQRSNNPYGEVSGTPTWSNAAGSKSGYGTYSTTVFEPADEYKGDIARVYFYMLTCYSDEDFTVNWKGQKVFTYINGQAGLTAAAKALFNCFVSFSLAQKN